MNRSRADSAYRTQYASIMTRNVNMHPLRIVNPLANKDKDEFFAWMMGTIDAVGDRDMNVEEFLSELVIRMRPEYREWWTEWQEETT